MTDVFTFEVMSSDGAVAASIVGDSSYVFESLKSSFDEEQITIAAMKRLQDGWLVLRRWQRIESDGSILTDVACDFGASIPIHDNKGVFSKTSPVFPVSLFVVPQPVAFEDALERFVNSRLLEDENGNVCDAFVRSYKI